MKRLYSDYLRAAREVEKEESMELSWNPQSQANYNTAKPKTTSFFHLWKLKGNQPVPKMPTVYLAHLEGESAKREKEEEIEDPDGIDRVTAEFMVCLAWTMKDAQVEENHCCHCSSPEHFAPQLPTGEGLQREYAVKLQGGDGIEEGSPDPSDENNKAQEPPGGGFQGVT